MSRWALSALTLLVFVTSAHADERWTHPYPGVRHLRKRAYQLDAQAVLIDLGSAHASVVATRPADRGINVREFAKRYNADIAINANYYDVGIRPCGLTAGDGMVWPDAYRENCVMSVGFGDLNEAEAFDSREMLRGPLPADWMKHVVSGKPWLVRKGVVQGGWYDPPHIHGSHPRTAIGLSQDRNTLILVVADGRRPGIPGVDGQTLATLLLELGAYDALNLDGGGSTALFIKAEGGIQNRPSDPLLREVGNHLGVRINTNATWYGAELEAMSSAPLLRPGDTGKLWVRYRNTGRFSWQPEGKHAVVLSSTSMQPNPFYLPGWASITAPVGLMHEVRSGETATFEFSVGAPAMIGNFSLDLVPTIAGVETMAPVPVRWLLAVEDSRAGLEDEVIAEATHPVTSTKEANAAVLATAGEIPDLWSNGLVWFILSVSALGVLFLSRLRHP